MESTVVLMNFTHVYEQEIFANSFYHRWVDCTDLTGTNCFCDATSASTIMKRINSYSPEGIHFIDSGNYHYVSKFWIDKIKEPFSLIVFDHHSDMQTARFNDMISCGCWIKVILDTNPYLRTVYIIGAKEESVNAIPSQYRNRVKFYNETELFQEDRRNQFILENTDHPLYISIDKDILNTTSAITNWDQGSLSLENLEKLLILILTKTRVIGVDVCGEYSEPANVFSAKRASFINSNTNKRLLTLVLSLKNMIHI